jgi:hypothetical protein
MRRITTSLILLIGLLVFSASDGSAQRLVGLFDLEMGVRAAAMGSAYVAVDDGNLGIFYNPAGLGTLRELHVNAFYESRFSRADQGVFSLAVPNFAAQLAILSVNGAVRRDENFQDIGALPYSQFGLVFGAGFTLDELSGTVPFDFDGLSVGSQFRLYSVSTTPGGSGVSFSLSPSILWIEERAMFGNIPLQFLRVGLIAPDLLSLGMSYGDGHRESWGPGLRIGASATTPGGLLIAADLDALGSFHIGVEWQHRGIEFGEIGMADISLRAGLKNLGNLMSPSIGFGFRLADIQVDYALILHSELPANHRFSISGIFGPPNFLLCALRPVYCPPDDP